MSQQPDGTAPNEGANNSQFPAALPGAGLNMFNPHQAQQLQAVLHLQQQQAAALQQQLNSGISLAQLQAIGQAQKAGTQPGHLLMQQLMTSQGLAQQLARAQQQRQAQQLQQAEQQGNGGANQAQAQAQATASSQPQQSLAQQAQQQSQQVAQQQQQQSSQMAQPVDHMAHIRQQIQQSHQQMAQQQSLVSAAASQPAKPMGSQGLDPSTPRSIAVPVSSAALPAPAQAQAQSQRAGGSQSAQGNNLPARIADAAPAVKRSKKRKAPAPILPEKLVDLLPESAVFGQLQEMERQVDGYVAERRAELMDSLRFPQRITKRLRLSINSQYLDQNAATRVADPPSWQLYITGQILDVAEAEGFVPVDENPTQTAAKPPVQPFLYYVKSLQVTLDPEQYPDNGVVTWDREKHEGPFKDQIEIRRRGSNDVVVNIKLELHNQPERFELCEPLGMILGFRTGTRAQLLSALWAYIRQHKLLASKPGIVEFNEKLQPIFGATSCNISALSQKMEAELQPMPALELGYVVRVSGDNPSKADVYDIELELPVFPPDGQLPASLEKLNRSTDVAQLEQRIVHLIRQIREHMRRRAFLLGFSTSPVGVINALIATQARELRTAQLSPGPQALSRSGLFQGKWVEDAVLRYLHRRIASGG